MSLWKGHCVGMAVNVSARQLDEDGLLDDVREAISQSGIEPGDLSRPLDTAAIEDLLEGAQSKAEGVPSA